MIFTPLKTGIAAACFVAVAILIAWEVSTAPRKAEPAPAAPPPAALVTLPPPPVIVTPPLVAPPKPDSAVLCPDIAAPAKEKDQKAAGAAEAAKPADAHPKTDAAPTPAPQAEQKMYTVVQGDSLYGISTKVYGTPRHYARIYELNRDRIKDPNTLQIGINLRLPELAGAPGAKP